MVKKSFSSRVANISLLATLASTALSHGAYAKIPLTAFKGVTRCFKSGKAFFSPTLGEAALESHLIDNYRFYGNYTPAKDENGASQHAQDASNGDPVWDMTRIFFPSPAGQLSAESTRATNFGNTVDKVETIALLLNYANNLREGNPIDGTLLKDSIFASLKSRPPVDISAEEEKRDFLKAALLGITETNVGELNAKIQEILTNETDKDLRSAINKAGNVKGKKLTLEQLQGVKTKMTDALEAYFTQKIQQKEAKFKKDEERFKKAYLEETLDPLLQSIQRTIQDEANSLYPEHTTEQIISSFFCYKFNTQKDVIDLMGNLDDAIVDKAKISQIAELKENDLPEIATHASYDMDDVLALETADIWRLLVPYRDGSAPLSNGNTYQYDRANNRSLKEERTFSDCAEIAARHLCNMLLYNPISRDWDLSHIQRHIATQSPGNKYFPNFEEFYKHQHPNLANSGDIQMRSLWNTVVGDLNAGGEGVKIAYVQGTNELETGYINLIRVFEKIFALPLKPFPMPIAGKDKENLDSKKIWLEDSFSTLFTVMNPTKTYYMDFSQLKETKVEVSGTLPITVSDQKTGEKLFSFSFDSDYGSHSAVKSLRTLKKVGTQDYTEALKPHATFIPENTAEEALWMVSSNPELRGMKLHHPLYFLFNQGLEDNTAKTRFLGTLNEKFEVLQPQMLESPEKHAAFKNMLENILSDFSWNDRHEVEKILPIIDLLLSKKAFEDVSIKTVKSITLESSSIETIKGLNIFRNLEKLNLSNTKQLKDVSFLEGLESLKEVNLNSSNVEAIEGLNTLKKLEELNASVTYKLKKVSLEGCESLKEVKLNSSTVEQVVLKTLKKLETLSLSTTPQLKKVSLEGCESLKTLHLNSSDVETIEGLNTLKKLETLNLSFTTQLKKVSLEDLESLKILNLARSSVETIDGLNTLKKLEKLNASTTYKLKKVSLEGCENLKEVNLNSSIVEKVDLNTLKELETLNLSSMSKLKEVSLEDLESLKDLDLRDSSIETLRLKNIKNIKEINLERLLNLKRVIFEGDFSLLRDLSFRNSGQLESIEGLEHLSNLRQLDLSGTTKLKSLSLTENNKDLALYLIEGSGLRRTNIKGINHLDDEKIFGGY